MRPLAAIALLFLLIRADLTQAQPTGQGEQAAPSHVRILAHVPTDQYPSVGSPHAPVLFEYFLNLGNARSFGPHKALQRLAQDHPHRLRIVYRLSDRQERSSNLAQIFGQEAFAQGRFFQFLEAFYSKRRGPSAAKDYPNVARTAGVNYSLVLEARTETRHDAFLNSNHYYWLRMQVPGIPGLLINGHRPARPSYSLETLEALYDEAWQESQFALASGVPREQLHSHLKNKARTQAALAPNRLTGAIDIDPGQAIPKSPQVPRVVRMQPLLRGVHRRGPLQAPLTLVFICHLQSNNCRSMANDLRSLRKAYAKELQIIVHPLFDSSLPKHNKAQLMHEAANCAGEQGAFWDYYELAFVQQRRINFDRSFATHLAASPLLSLDLHRFEGCLESGRYTESVQKQVERVREAGVLHVPALAVSGLLYLGRLNFSQLRSLVESELAAGLLEAQSLGIAD